MLLLLSVHFLQIREDRRCLLPVNNNNFNNNNNNNNNNKKVRWIHEPNHPGVEYKVI